MLTFVCFLLVAFLIGSLPTGFIIGKCYGKDIRKIGSGNTGATNALRTLGKSAGVVTLLGDMAKGVIPILLPTMLLGDNSFANLYPLLGVSAVLGHCYSPFLGFNGGKGVATSFAVFLYLAPLATIAAVFVFVVVLKTSKYVSLSSLSAALTASALAILKDLHFDTPVLTASIVTVTAIIFTRHRANISRLIRGEELPYTANKESSRVETVPTL